jgi:hypothetical protein
MLATTGCKGGGNTSTASTGTSGSMTSTGTGGSITSAGTSSSMTSTGTGGSFPVDAGSCAQDPLHTGLPPLFNGNSVDSDDCPILQLTAKYGEPDAMIFKAIIYVESRFQYDAVGCTGNSGCCPQRGWTGAECGCLGSMQTGPWCDPSNLPPGCTGNDGLGLLPNMHVDLETNPSAADWANSVFNPDVNIELGIAGIACNRAQAKAQFPGCTEDQYTMMAVGNFNSYGSTQSCTVYNFAYDSSVLDAYKTYAAAASWPTHPYVAQ